jgi:hypothetical protein
VESPRPGNGGDAGPTTNTPTSQTRSQRGPTRTGHQKLGKVWAQLGFEHFRDGVHVLDLNLVTLEENPAIGPHDGGLAERPDPNAIEDRREGTSTLQTGERTTQTVRTVPWTPTTSPEAIPTQGIKILFTGR